MDDLWQSNLYMMIRNIFNDITKVIYSNGTSRSNSDLWHVQNSMAVEIFPLIQSPFVKLTQLAKFDKPSEAKQHMELLIV